MSSNEEYWEDFYKSFDVTKPSHFAYWAEPRITGRMVFDIGCGNGRDTEFLRQEHRVLGIDPQAPLDFSYARWTAQRFVRETSPLATDTVYARWFFHAVEESVENMVLKWCRGQLLLEARVVGDKLDGTHFRRPLDLLTFVPKLFDYGYDLKFLEVSRDFSPLGSDYTPLLVRIEAQRRA